MLPIHAVPQSVLAFLALDRPTNGLVLAETDAVISHLRARQNELWTQSQDILARCEAENHRELTDEERIQLDELDAEFERKKGEIERRERVIAQGTLMQAPAAARVCPILSMAKIPRPVRRRRRRHSIHRSVPRSSRSRGAPLAMVGFALLVILPRA